MEVFADPLNEVVFKCPFDRLVQQIRADQLINISVWKLRCEGLNHKVVS